MTVRTPPTLDGVADDDGERALLLAALGLPSDGIDPVLLGVALTHRSYAYEQGNPPTNERLEFLGDAVLGLVVTEELYGRHPDRAEGHLARMRSAVVNRDTLAEVGMDLQLGRWVLLGKGEERTGGRERPSILADTVEAVIGACYLTGGLEPARALVLGLVGPAIDRAAKVGPGLDWKTSLQELTAEHGLGVPDYTVVESGPDHAKSFVATVRVGDDPYGEGSGSTKKEAEQGAAERAYTRLRAELPLDGDG